VRPRRGGGDDPQTHSILAAIVTTAHPSDIDRPLEQQTMTDQSTIHYERTSPQVAKITFVNPPVNLVVGETVLRLAKIVDELAADPDIQVVVFDSGVPDFFFNHFDLAAAAGFPAPKARTWCRCGRTWS
jgi:hypothetical protein